MASSFIRTFLGVEVKSPRDTTVKDLLSSETAGSQDGETQNRGRSPPFPSVLTLDLPPTVLKSSSVVIGDQSVIM